MSNYFGQSSPQINNKYNRSQFVGEYKQFVNSDTPYSNNNVLSQNPVFMNMMNNSNFNARVNMEKMAYTKRPNSVADLKLTQKQLAEYIIRPQEDVKIAKAEFEKSRKNLESIYKIEVLDNGKVSAPTLIMDWWKNRTNTPYKRILTKEEFKKEFKDITDLIVHKYTKLDKDWDVLENQFNNLKKIILTDEQFVEALYSISEKAKNTKIFNYENKIKNRIKYDPKNSEDLKKYYKKQHNKLNKDSKRIDNMIDMLIDNDVITREDLEEIEKETKTINEEQISSVEEIKIDINDCDDADDALEKVRQTIGEKEYAKILSELGTSDNIKSDTKQKVSRVKVTDIEPSKASRVKVTDIESSKASRVKVTYIESSKVSRVKVTDIETEKKQTNELGNVSDIDIEMYKKKRINIQKKIDI